MNKKRTPRKLSLSRETLQNLTFAQLREAAGGESFGTWCVSCGGGGTCVAEGCTDTCEAPSYCLMC
jgi:hypothetical protein